LIADSFIGVLLQFIPLLILCIIFQTGAVFQVKRNEVQS